ncbi:hypothetical protein DY000_02063250 [Brassica cretica]|uniref:TPX2 C-terminal domain-containing protein n=1 Tax=Brassica cretica TaxID=69181 RepID=A0ABQ7B4T2_BRACR|nr:hypothetical protein DY000_02063250 [Brassica cretica]
MYQESIEQRGGVDQTKPGKSWENLNNTQRRRVEVRVKSRPPSPKKKVTTPESIASQTMRRAPPMLERIPKPRAKESRRRTGGINENSTLSLKDIEERRERELVLENLNLVLFKIINLKHVKVMRDERK